jgi:hypothetical protein
MLPQQQQAAAGEEGAGGETCHVETSQHGSLGEFGGLEYGGMMSCDGCRGWAAWGEKVEIELKRRQVCFSMYVFVCCLCLPRF